MTANPPTPAATPAAAADAHPAAADPKLALLRHTVATLAYRGGKTLRGSPPGFGELRAAPGARTALEILAHLGDLLEWAASQARGQAQWRPAPPLPWDEQVARFYSCLAALDGQLAAGAPLGLPAEAIFQGAIADAFTHVGQIAMLRRLAGAPVRGENYSRAQIVAGRVGPDQAPPAVEFD